MLPKLHKEF
ncbi:hypothetical protein CGLO_14816 [Colletotrichum gloeosporioides Cg-14]|uniref:Uncharacterized protein n=1 Tax=Colletotrichum gloeosporioides (strain Cg-14) TaxID=1237896 RepID=T0JSS6_COLGC|nr:hypothetical protein CGLO_14816 [Colletotrichum gloeosporioides Cg-14]